MTNLDHYYDAIAGLPHRTPAQRVFRSFMAQAIMNAEIALRVLQNVEGLDEAEIADSMRYYCDRVESNLKEAAARFDGVWSG